MTTDDEPMQRMWAAAAEGNGHELGYMSLKTLRAFAKYMDKRGMRLRSDIQGFLNATTTWEDCMVQITPHSIALAPPEEE